jgi:ribonuclease D
MNDSLDIEVADGDLSFDQFESLQIAAKEYGLAIDTETDGLTPGRDELRVVSLAVPHRVVVLALSDETPTNLKRLLRNDDLTKIFHHALFDLSFIASKWGILPPRVYCTKVAARVAGLDLNPSLQYLVGTLLGVTLDKEQRRSDWSHRPLSPEQLSYAASDVKFLHDLQRVLTRPLSDAGQTELFDACMAFLPSRVTLGIRGLKYVFA